MRQPTLLPIYTGQPTEVEVRHHKRRTPPPAPLERSSPAVGRAEELSPLDPDVAHHKSVADGMRSMASSMAPAGAAGGVVERGRRDTGRLERSGWSSCPPVPANSQAPGALLPTVVLRNSGDLEAIRGSGIVEGVKGYMVEGSIAPDSGMPGNGDSPNSSDFRCSAAPQLFDRKPNRDSALTVTLDAVLEEGEVWEKGPDLVMRERNQVRGIFRHPWTEGVGHLQLTPARADAGSSRSSGAESSLPENNASTLIAKTIMLCSDSMLLA